MEKKKGLVYGLHIFYKDGTDKKGFIFTPSMKVAKRWKKQKMINSLIDDIVIFTKILNSLKKNNMKKNTEAVIVEYMDYNGHWTWWAVMTGISLKRAIQAYMNDMYSGEKAIFQDKMGFNSELYCKNADVRSYKIEIINH